MCWVVGFRGFAHTRWSRGSQRARGAGCWKGGCSSFPEHKLLILTFLPASGYMQEAFGAKLPPPCLSLPDKESVRHEVLENDDLSTAYSTVPVNNTVPVFSCNNTVPVFI